MNTTDRRFENKTSGCIFSSRMSKFFTVRANLNLMDNILIIFSFLF